MPEVKPKGLEDKHDKQKHQEQCCQLVWIYIF